MCFGRIHGARLGRLANLTEQDVVRITRPRVPHFLGDLCIENPAACADFEQKVVAVQTPTTILIIRTSKKGRELLETSYGDDSKVGPQAEFL